MTVESVLADVLGNLLAIVVENVAEYDSRSFSHE
jgi:hypothetical protein